MSEMNTIERFFKEQDKVAMMLCGILLVIAIGVIAIGIIGICTSNNDDRPSWANDMASQLDEKGGRVWVYNEGASGYSARIDYTVNANDDVYADSHGIVVRGSGGVTVFPYDKIWGIYPTGGAA